MSETVRCHSCKGICSDLDRKCEKCRLVFYCCRKCSRGADAKEHYKQCGKSIENTHQRRNLFSRDTLRFKKNDQVYLFEGGSWLEAIVTETAYRDRRGICAYVVRIFSNNSELLANLRRCNNEELLVDDDNDQSIRRRTSSSLDLLLSSLQYGDPIGMFIGILEDYKLDLKVIGEQVLLKAASCGIPEVFKYLLYNDSINKFCVDGNNMTILHIAIMNKCRECIIIIVIYLHIQRYELVNHIIASQNIDGNTILHQLVKTGDYEFSTWFITYVFDENRKMNALVYSDISMYINFQSTNREGKTAEELALAMGLCDIANILNLNSRREVLVRALRCCHWNYDQRVEVEEKLRLAVQGIDLTDLPLFNNSFLQEYVAKAAYDMVRASALSPLKWFVKDWHLDLKYKLPEPWRYRYEEDLMSHIIICGSQCDFPVLKLYYENTNGETDKFHSELFSRLYWWDGIEDFAKELKQLMGRKDYDGEFRSFTKLILNNYTGDIDVYERRQILQWLAVEQRLPFPPPSFFVIHGQSHLLDWLASDPQRVDMCAPMDGQLRQQCRTYPWLTDIEGNGSSADLNVGEVLSMLAAGLGQFGVLKMLLEKHVRRRDVKCSGGRNLLHIAAEREQFIVVKYLIASGYLMIDALSTAGFNACHLAIKHKAEFVARFLIEIMSETLDSKGMSMSWHAAQSEIHSLVKWVDCVRKVEDVKEIHNFLLEQCPSSFLMDYLCYCGLEPFSEAFVTIYCNDYFISIHKEGVPTRYDEDRFHLFLFMEAIRLKRLDFIDWSMSTICINRSDRSDALLLEQFALNFKEYAIAIGVLDIAAYIESIVQPAVSRSNYINEMKEACRKLQLVFCEGRSVEDIEAVAVLQNQLHDFIDEDPREFSWSYENLLLNENCHTYFKEERLLQCPFDYAAYHGYSHLVDWMLQNCDITEADLVSSILFAAEKGRLEVVQIIIAEMKDQLRIEPSMDSKDYFGYGIVTSLIKACGYPFPIRFDSDMEDTCHPHILRYLLPEVEYFGCDRSLSKGSFLSKVRDRLTEQEIKDIEGYQNKSVLRSALEHLIENDSDLGWGAFLVVLDSAVVDINIDSSFDNDREKLFWQILMNSCDIYAHSFISAYDKITLQMRKRRAEHCMNIFLCMVRHGYRPKLNADKILDTYSIAGDVRHMSLQFLKYFAEHYNTNLQGLKIGHYHSFHASEGFDAETECKAADEFLAKVKLEQKQRWAIFDLISEGVSVLNFKTALHGSPLFLKGKLLALKDKNGLNVMEVAAVVGRIDLIHWLSDELSISDKDLPEGFLGLSVFARSAGALEAHEVLMEMHSKAVISRFCVCHFHKKKFRRRLLLVRFAVVEIQKKFRMYLAYRRYSPLLQSRRGSYERFRSMWSDVLLFLSQQSLPPCFRWMEMREQYDMFSSEEQDRVGDTALSQLIVEAATIEDDLDEDHQLSQQSTTTISEIMYSNSDYLHNHCVNVQSIEVSSAVNKWLQTCDARYRNMFCQRIERLASGDRSYALSKRLSHCRCPVFESKLDAGQRILWTPLRRAQAGSIMVWFVSKHDKVSHFVQLIEKSILRAVGTSEVQDNYTAIFDMSEDDILLDPVGNSPLKIFVTRTSEISLLSQSGWQPPMLLNAREREICEQQGTVLLLGRSGTGKTLCLCQRMIRDRSVLGEMQCQLFVSRSRRLCNFVSRYQEELRNGSDESNETTTDYLILDRFMNRLDDAVSRENGHSSTCYVPDRHVDFRCFRDKFFSLIKQQSTLDALVVWTQIRSFIKGSVECVLQGSHISLDQYLDMSVFGKDRCRLLDKQRRQVYDIYVRYQDVLTRHDYWDDSDRVLDLLKRANLSDTSMDRNYSGRGGPYAKVYVDEVQDYSQAEIVLFFLAAGLDTTALFLAGDPVQAVVEGVDFRFEEVRSIVHKLTDGQAKLNRPVHLLTNFRSHSGILSCAAVVVERLLKVFPGSASVLPPDRGLYQGPRPAYLQLSEIESLLTFLVCNERLVVLCPDEEVKRIQSCLNAHCGKIEDATDTSTLVLGIRAAKGLEFSDVVLLDYFSNISPDDQRHWQTLFSVRSGSTLLEDVTMSFPQIETQLKVLYTGITRCCNRLLFVETKVSPAGSTFFRYLSSCGLAQPFRLSSLQDEAMLMTPDEWMARGLDLVMASEVDSNALEESSTPHFDMDLLNRARECFKRAGDTRMIELASVHLEMESTRLKLTSGFVHSQRKLGAVEELEVASLVGRALKLGMYTEVKALCVQLELCVFEPMYFQRELMRHKNMEMMGINNN